MGEAFKKTVHYSDDGVELVEAADYAAMRGLLDIEPGVDVQAYSARLAEIAALGVTDGSIIVGNGLGWVLESGATARASLGLGTIATQAANAVAITGGAIDGTPIGVTSVSSVRANSISVSALTGNPITIATGGVTVFYVAAAGHLKIPRDLIYLTFGEADDVLLYYNGTDFVINPKSVGSGILDLRSGLKIGGPLNANGYTIHFGTAENEATIATGTNPNTCTVNLSAENHWTIPANDANNPINATITMPPGPCGGTIFVDNGSTPRDITWLPAESVLWLGTEPDLADASEANQFHGISWRFNGTYVFLSDAGKTSITP